MEDTFLLQRFVDAQQYSYENVIRELKEGGKRTCWMWFVFPQVVGLGRTSTAEKYSIKSIEEAKAYIAHPVLGNRLQECTKLVVNIVGRTANQIFGFPDDLKFRSSMTLFNYVVEGKKNFKDAIVKFYDGKEDNLTIEVLKKWQK
ncbi:MAG: DUF1810 domain-containing protein [Desulfobulbaceae bacterium]|nr:DUF1810 domain-containing protein [Desulfobulbaceae bacterium]